jgi:hypothetical protein
MENVVNKAGIQPIPTDHYTITGSEVVKYLQDQLGFGVAFDFTRWTGAVPDLSYVRMRVVFNPKDIVVDSAAKDYVDRKLEEYAAGTKFDSDTIEILKPFMYPTNINELRNNPEDMQRLYMLGILEDRFDEIVRNAKLNYCREANVFRLYLRPERIIEDMLRNPTTNKIDGTMSILGVRGTSSETIRWDVAVTRKPNAFIGNSELSVDAIFNRA